MARAHNQKMLAAKQEEERMKAEAKLDSMRLDQATHTNPHPYVPIDGYNPNPNPNPNPHPYVPIDG